MAVKPTLATKAATKLQPSAPLMLLKHIPSTRVVYPVVRASQSMEDKSKVFKELGMFALRKKIEDAVLRVEALAPTALELEEARRIEREEVIRGCDLWDDPAKSSEVLVKLADSAKVVDSLKDLKYKAEEAKLIVELVETDAVNHHLFRLAHSASVDVSKFLDQYEMSKILRGPFDMHGALLVINARDEDSSSEIWAECLLNMYLKWAEKQGRKGRIAEKHISRSGGISSASIEFEFDYAYGYLLGEGGVHQLLSSHEPSLAAVDVVPLFLESFPDLPLDEKDIRISSGSPRAHEHGRVATSVSVQHLPTGISVQSCGERSQFANKMKALNRLKAKLLVILCEQRVSSIQSIKRDAIFEPWKQETRRYTLYPSKLVLDLKTGFQLNDLNSVLDGNIELLFAAHANMRHSNHE